MGPEGDRRVESFGEKKAAEKAAAAYRRQFPGRVTVGDAIEKFEQHLVVGRGCRVSSAETTSRWLRNVLDLDMPLSDITPKKMQQYYLSRTEKVSPDSHQRELVAVKDFLSWCVEKGWMPSSPAAKVKPIGKRRKGKVQLRRSEAQAFYQTALEEALDGKDAGVAALSVLMLGLRAGEILYRRVRDVDSSDSGVLLWVEHGKTEAATRC